MTRSAPQIVDLWIEAESESEAIGKAFRLAEQPQEWRDGSAVIVEVTAAREVARQ